MKSLETDGQPMPVSADMKHLTMATSLSASVDDLSATGREDVTHREGTEEVLDHTDIQLTVGETITEAIGGVSVSEPKGKVFERNIDSERKEYSIY